MLRHVLLFYAQFSAIPRVLMEHVFQMTHVIVLLVTKEASVMSKVHTYMYNIISKWLQPGLNFPVFSVCEGNPCQNGGTCQRHVLTYSCTCLSPYFGDSCEQNFSCARDCPNGANTTLDEDFNEGNYSCAHDCPSGKESSSITHSQHIAYQL